MSRRVLNRVAFALGAIMLASVGALAQTEVRDEFHQSYPLAAQGRVTLKNISGAVRITAWDRAEVRVDAVKRGETRERVDEAKIVVDASAESVNIETRYPDDAWARNEHERHRQGASVDYTLSVPRGARLESIELISGQLEIEGVAGGVKASCISGKFTARNLSGEAKLTNVSGTLEATFERLDDASNVMLANVSGAIILVIPSDTNGTLKANTLSGSISNDLGLPVRRGEYVGNDMAGQLGRGGARLKVSNVSGTIKIQRAADGRGATSVTNLISDARREREGQTEDEVRRQVEREVERAMREASLEDKRANHESARANRTQTAELERNSARMARDAERAARDAERTAREIERSTREMTRVVQDERRVVVEGDSSYRLVERESKSFATSGTPRVVIKTFDGSINIQPSDGSTVSFTATKRARDEQAMRGIRLLAEQRGDGVYITAEFDKTLERHDYGTGAEVTLEVQVPRSANLNVKSGDGRLRLTGIGGDIELNTGDGSVEVLQSRGRLRVQTGDGRVLVSGFDGDATVQTGDGRITLDGRFTQLSARTGDGAISLALPEGSNARIETDSERVINDLSAVAEDGEAETGERRVRHWRVGSGAGGTITLHTGDGQIVLRRAGDERE